MNRTKIKQDALIRTLFLYADSLQLLLCKTKYNNKCYVMGISNVISIPYCINKSYVLCISNISFSKAL